MKGHETEVKFYVKDLPRIETRLLEMKARLIQTRVHEINYRYDTPDGKLRKDFNVLRLRKDAEAKFTFKGPGVEHEGVIRRREIEFTVGDFEAAKQFLEALGYLPTVFYEKFRATYELNEVQVMLDELPYGNFVEIEGESVGSIRKTADGLGLRWDSMVKAGYHFLFEQMAEKYNLDPSQLSFAVFGHLKISVEDISIEAADCTPAGKVKASAG